MNGALWHTHQGGRGIYYTYNISIQMKNRFITALR